MDTQLFKKNISEKKYHLDKTFFDKPRTFGSISIIQIGRLHCTPHTVIGMHPHRNWFEITVVTDGEGSVITGNTEVSFFAGDIHLSYPGDFHEIRSCNTSPLKYDFFSFYTEEPFLIKRLETIMQSRPHGRARIIRDEKIRQLLENAIVEINNPTELSDEILAANLRQIVLYLIRGFQTDKHFQKATPSTPEELCYQIMHYIDTHIYTMDNLSELANAMNYNYSYLSDHFKHVTGDTIQGYYQTRRLRAAQLLMQESNIKLGEIANLLRYSSIYTFSRAFKDQFGMTPSEYRKKKADLPEKYQSSDQ